ncbi:MAG: methyltransferase domain-containing protein [Myxococcales bacterium]|nr:methyltransferase domain-containing protein [Myxococcales bacterium]
MVHVVAYNAASTLAKVLDRIPSDLRPRLAEVCVFDDASKDDTFLVGQGYKATRDMPMLQVFRNPVNRGYGGNQKLGYRYAIDKGYDVVVLLHGDGQYAPEAMPALIQPILDGEADAVFGSRMLEKGAARRGGMPLYKYVGNKILTRFENAALGMNLSEFHSGYRVYSVAALKRIPFEANTDDFHFDTQIIVQLKAGGFRIKEVPIPTYYGDEICHVNGMKYAKDVARAVIDFRRHEAGLVNLPEYAHSSLAKYTKKESPFSSHHRIIEAVRAGSKVLDVGCAGGYIARALKAKGCEVIGVDSRPDAAASAACDRLYVADLDGSAWEPEERDFDYILYGDVLEHLRDVSLLARSRAWLAPHGRVIASTGNVALWFMRLQLALGNFKYTPRGILDETHVHLYTRDTFRALLEEAGLKVVAEDSTVIPLEQLFASSPGFVRGMEQLTYQMARLWPGLFAYQFVLQAE